MGAHAALGEERWLEESSLEESFESYGSLDGDRGHGVAAGLLRGARLGEEGGEASFEEVC